MLYLKTAEKGTLKVNEKFPHGTFYFTDYCSKVSQKRAGKVGAFANGDEMARNLDYVPIPENVVSLVEKIPVYSAQIDQLISELAKDFCIILVTHNLSQALRVSNYTVFFIP